MSQPQGPVYENPSADKFEPPARSGSRSDDERRRRRIRTAWVLGIYAAVRFLWPSFRGRGWLTPSLIATFGYGVYTIIEQRMRRDDNDPPPTNITR